jgi:hypothetical protein
MQWLIPTLLNGLFGIAAGTAALLVFIPLQRLLSAKNN